MSRRARLFAGVAAVVAAVAAAAVAWSVYQARQARQEALDNARSAAEAFAGAWAAHDGSALAQAAGGEPPDLAARYAQTREELGLRDVEVTVPDVRLRDEDDLAAGAVADYVATLRLDGLGAWEYRGELDLAPRRPADPRGAPWRVDWTPAALHPDLAPGRRLARFHEFPPRAPILGADGRPIDGSGAETLGRLVGEVGPADADAAERLGPRVREGDPVGVSGLQQAFDERLGGRPAGGVRLLDADGQALSTLFRVDGAPGRPLPTGLDPAVQRAAEAALGSSTGAGGMAVVDPASGAVRALVPRPADGFNWALSGRYPPGSTFKTVTTAALLRHGVVTPDTPVSCPPEARVGGRPFTNFEDQAFGTIPFREAFFRSCNTAFVQLAAQLPEGALSETAGTFGFDGDWDTEIGEPVASFPPPRDLAERAAAAFGQARVEASPVQMAAVAAAFQSGRYRPPRFVVEGGEPPAGSDVSDVAPTVAELMKLVPTLGTAAGSGVPAGVAGKTGTAEYGTEDPPRTHAWFIGFDDRAGPPLAFAVLVEDAPSGGAAAAPVAAAFLRELGRG